MQYAQLVKLYLALEKTTKHLEKTKLIADFLKEVPKETIKDVVYLVQGKVFPPWDERKIGFSSRSMLKVISVASGASLDKVEHLWSKKGDLGIVASELLGRKSQSTLVKEELTVQKVIDNIRKLSTLEGAGTVDKKIGLVAELLTSASSDEARFIARTVLEELRVGIAAGILRDSIAQATGYSVEDVERAADILADYGTVAQLAKEGKLDKVSLEPGRPMQMMLSIPVKDVTQSFEELEKPAQFEYKLDGFRCITGHTPIYCLNKGYISVKDLQRKDLVLTHKGNFKEVLALNYRIIDKKERLFELQTFFGNKIKISEGHPILVLRDGKETWLSIEKVNKHDLLVFPKPKILERSLISDKLVLSDDSGYKKTILVDDFFFRFLGFWIGDGFTNNYHNTERVGLLFNRKTESQLCDYYFRNIKYRFGIKNVTKSIQGNLINLYFRDKPLRIWLTENFRIRDFKNDFVGKRLPRWFLGIHEKQFTQFIKGYLESDGHTDKFGRSSIITKERDLAMFVQLLALKFKKVYGLSKVRIDKGTYYKIRIPKSQKHYIVNNDNYYIKILKLNDLKRDPRIKLYNLQVEDDESYCTALVALHNCQIHKTKDNITIFTRRLENVTKQFPEVNQYVKDFVKGNEFIIDCEAVGFDPKTGKHLPFQNISQRIKRKYDIEQLAKKLPVEVNVFDIMYYDGKMLMEDPLSERRALLEKIVKNMPKQLKLTEKLVTDSVEAAQEFYDTSLAKGNEGLMIKKIDVGYRPGRYVGGWCKLKPVLEPLDLVIVGASYGEGKRAAALSSYVIACQDEEGNLLEVGRVSTGVKEKEEEGVTFEALTKLLKPLITRTKGLDVVVKPKIVVEVAYEEVQKSPTYTSGYALRFPRFKRLRVDEKIVDDVNTLDDIERIFKVQKGKKPAI